MGKRVPPLSAKAIAALKPVPGKTVELVDGFVPGLRIRMSPSGSTSWSLNIRDAAGDMRRFTLIGSTSMGLAEAREKAREMRESVRSGKDPTAERKAVRDRAANAREGLGTLSSIVALYFTRGPGSELRTRAEMHRAIRAVFGAELALPAGDVSVSALLLAADNYKAPVSANRAASYLRPVLKWAAKCKLVAGEDWRDVARPNREAPKQRVLTHDELARLLPVLGVTPHGRALRFMLWTATRLDEVVSCTWGEFDLEAGLWSLPAERRKGGVLAHTVPLSRQAVAYLHSIGAGRGGDLVFTGGRGAALANWARACGVINAPLGLPPWSAHAMRRTCATLAGQAGTQPHVLSAMLGHSAIGSQLLAGYNKARYGREVSEALQIVADRLDVIETGLDNIVAFSGRSK